VSKFTCCSFLCHKLHGEEEHTDAAAAAAAAAGIAFFYGGMVHSKNVVSTIMQAFLPLAIIPVVWSAVG
jgi:Amt family ammonium transporter